MPELPEVETVRRGLEPVLTGARIVRVEQNRPNLRFPFPKQFAARLKGRTTGPLSRRAKYLLIHLDKHETLVIHLGMSGRITIEKPQDAEPQTAQGSRPDPAHDHVVFHLGDGTTIRYNDPRRFGFMELVGTGELDSHRLFKNLGPEPLGNEFHAHHLANRAKNRKTSLKSFLLDQKTVAGLGNIYVCEALFRAHLSPTRPASVLARRDAKPGRAAERLTLAIKEVLGEAIDKGGSTLRDHRLTDGSLGYFQHSFRVYGREHQPCCQPSCKGIVEKMTQAGRSTFHCPACQK